MTVDQMIAIEKAKNAYLAKDLYLMHKFNGRNAADITPGGYFESWHKTFEEFILELDLIGLSEQDPVYHQLAQELGLANSWM
jgi:hypothetical protein